jgi:threonine 3-dehydrogenase
MCMSAPQEICVKLPDGVAVESAALLEAAGVAVHAIQRSGHAVAGGSVLISGAGPIGLVLARLSRQMGAAHVVVVEPNPFRRAQADELGVRTMLPGEEVVETCRELPGRRGGFDVASTEMLWPRASGVVRGAVRLGPSLRW